MENNSPQPQPVQSAQPVPAAPVTGGGGDSKKMVMMLVIGLVIIILIVGGIYYFLSQKQPAPQPAPQTGTKTSQPTLANIKDALDQELDSINVSAAEGDFKDVDSDLQNL